MSLHSLTIHEARDGIVRGEFTATALLEAVLGRIEALDGKVKAYLSVTADAARAQAARVDEARGRGEPLGPLAGVPIALKDIFCTKGVRTTCGSRILENFVPPYNATVVERLAEAGAVLVGKTNMDEFAMGSSCENSAFGPTRNPWDLERVPGGSSGGSAAAVAAGECLGALGTDTGGSVRQPAANCGVVGMKPTYGRVSRYGVVAFASSLDQVGPLTKDVTDCAILLRAIAGHDPRDSTSIPEAVPDYEASLREGLSDLTIGLPREYFGEGTDPEVLAAVRGAAESLQSMGAKTREVSLATTPYAVAAYYLIAPAEASSNLARYDGVKYGYRTAEAVDLLDMYVRTRSEGFGAEVKRRIMLGTYALSSGYYDAYYRKATSVRSLIRREFEESFRECDVLLTPVAPTAAFRIGEKIDDPLTMYMSDVFTIPVNLAGIPGLSLPCGFTREGLPIGLQILARPLAEGTILRVAHAYEQAHEWHRRRPEPA
ncbi:MAG: Asp-tRNA(Asn)/Glu-tRNA(Gln) amidotransferase subunit GatA [Deltaproteobacteria bacterium]|nr:Asp-tRNA(Asn)/Glu-tRNA(Gln) amidotransferase subunit GatA [Deltaproteobacteria bacterium]